MTVSKSRLFLLIATFCTLSTAHALVVHEIDTTKPLQITFSSTHQNRIAVDDGYVKKVIAPQEVFSINMEKESGQVFVSAKEIGTKSSVLSIVTSNSLVQDLEIIFEERSPEVVILKEPIEPEPSASSIATAHEDNAIRAISHILKDSSLPGYTQRELTPDLERTYSNQAISVLPLQVYEGPFQKFIVYSLTNEGETRVSLQEKLFKQKGDTWVYLEQQLLEPNTRTIAIIGVCKPS